MAAKNAKVISENLPVGICSTGSSYNAEIVPGKSIRIYGVETNHVRGPQQFDKTFSVGDEAEYDSYNLRYTGQITSIGEKTVTVWDGINGKGRRLTLGEFIRRNWRFDAAEIANRNAAELMCI